MRKVRIKGNKYNISSSDKNMVLVPKRGHSLFFKAFHTVRATDDALDFNWEVRISNIQRKLKMAASGRNSSGSFRIY